MPPSASCCSARKKLLSLTYLWIHAKRWIFSLPVPWTECTLLFRSLLNFKLFTHQSRYKMTRRAYCIDPVCQGFPQSVASETLFLGTSALLNPSSSPKQPHISIISFTRRPLSPLLRWSTTTAGSVAPFVLHSSKGMEVVLTSPPNLAHNTCRDTVRASLE